MIMSITDQIIDKKDLKAYINWRIKGFEENMKREMREAPIKTREQVKIKLLSKMSELRYLKGRIDNIKRASCEACQSYHINRKYNELENAKTGRKHE
jgi:hypothetical protein